MTAGVHLTLATLNDMDQKSFVNAVGWVFEHSPWVAERAWKSRPFADLSTLHAAMTQEVARATEAEQRALLCAHPDLGTRARVSDASKGEQAGVGLDRLTENEFQRLTRLNADYKTRFAFPFLYAVKGSTKHDILEALEARIHRLPDQEFAVALEQVYRIARFRLEDLIQ